MAINLMPIAKQQFLDNNGNPLTGGKVYTYVAGTNDPADTYSNQNGTLNTNPVVLNNRGEADIWLSSALKYKIVLTDSNDAEIWSVDNVSATGGAGGSGGDTVKIDATDISAGYLADKLEAGKNIKLTTLDNGGNKSLLIDATATTAGLLDTLFLTGDTETTATGTFYLIDGTSKGTVAEISQSVTNNDNQTGWFSQDFLSTIVVGTPRTLNSGKYEASLTTEIDNNAGEQQWHMEVYLADVDGNVEASGIAGQPVGDLGVQVISTLESAVLDIQSGVKSDTILTGFLTEDFEVPVDKRILIHIGATKVGTQGDTVQFTMYAGQDADSFIDIPAAIIASNVEFDNTNTGVSSTNVQSAIDTIDGMSSDLKYNYIGDFQVADPNTITVNAGECAIFEPVAGVKYLIYHEEDLDGVNNSAYFLESTNSTIISLKAEDKTKSFKLKITSFGQLSANVYIASPDSIIVDNFSFASYPVFTKTSIDLRDKNTDTNISYPATGSSYTVQYKDGSSPNFKGDISFSFEPDSIFGDATWVMRNNNIIGGVRTGDGDNLIDSLKNPFVVSYFLGGSDTLYDGIFEFQTPNPFVVTDGGVGRRVTFQSGPITFGITDGVTNPIFFDTMVALNAITSIVLNVDVYVRDLTGFAQNVTFSGTGTLYYENFESNGNNNQPLPAGWTGNIAKQAWRKPTAISGDANNALTYGSDNLPFVDVSANLPSNVMTTDTPQTVSGVKIFTSEVYGISPSDVNAFTTKSYVDNLVNGVASGLQYQGTWNAAANIPDLTNPAAKVEGHYYIVGTAGSTDLNGITDWKIGDWVLWSENALAWQKVDNTSFESVTNVGSGAGIFKQITGGTDVQLKSLTGDSYITLTENASDIQIGTQNLVTTNTAQTITGAKTFESQSATGLVDLLELKANDGANIAVRVDEDNKEWRFRAGGIGSGGNDIVFSYFDSLEVLRIKTGSANGGIEVGGNITTTGDLLVNSSASQVIGGFGANTTGGVKSWDDVTNARSGSGQTLLFTDATNGSLPHSPDFYHPFSFEFNSKDGTGNLTQFAIPYRTQFGKLNYRSRFSGVWQEWAEFLSSKPHATERVYNFPTSTNSFPSNGDIWFDGTNVQFREGGASKKLSDYVDLTSAQTITGAKTIDNDLEVNEILAVGLTNSSEASLGQNLSMGATASYSWLQSWNSRPLRINGLGNAIEIGSLTRFLTFNNSSPSNGDIWNNGLELEARGILRLKTGSTTGEIKIGSDTGLTTDNQEGYRVRALSGGVFVDHKTHTGGALLYRCGEGAETGQTHTFMDVDSTDGSVNFPNNVNLTKRAFFGATSGSGMSFNGEMGRDADTMKFVQRSKVQQMFGMLPTSTGTDLNGGDYVDPGHVLSATSVTNRPAWFNANRIQVTCFHGSSTAYKTQIAMQEGKSAIRTYESGVWTAWAAITSNINTVTDGSTTPESDTYPEGEYYYTVTTGSINYPATFGMVKGVREGNSRHIQYFYERYSSNIYFRYQDSASNTWSSWALQGSGGGTAVLDIDFGRKFTYNPNDAFYRGLNDTGPTKYTARKACVFKTISYNWGTAPTSAYKFQYSINGGTWTDFNASTIAANDADGYQDAGATISLSANDNLELRCNQQGTSPALVAYLEE